MAISLYHAMRWGDIQRKDVILVTILRSLHRGCKKQRWVKILSNSFIGDEFPSHIFVCFFWYHSKIPNNNRWTLFSYNAPFDWLISQGHCIYLVPNVFKNNVFVGWVCNINQKTDVYNRIFHNHVWSISKNFSISLNAGIPDDGNHLILYNFDG